MPKEEGKQSGQVAESHRTADVGELQPVSLHERSGLVGKEMAGDAGGAAMDWVT